MPESSFTERVADVFRARPGEWIDARELMAIGGVCAWRTRVSDARRQFGLDIENRTERVALADGRRITRSLYRLWPNGRLF